MNYSALLKGLMAEVSANKNLRRLPAGLRVLLVIALLPFTVTAWSLLLVYAAYSFIFNMLASAVAYLEAWLHGERKDVRHATEAVLYFVATPTIFLMHCVLSAFACLFFIVWFFMQCFFFVGTLGAIRFQPYINTASYEDGDSDYRMSIPHAMLVVSTAVSFGHIVLAFLCYLIYISTYEHAVLASPTVLFFWTYAIFTVVASIICSKKARVTATSTAATALPDDSDEHDELELPEV